MKNVIYKLPLVAGLFFFAAIVFTSCSKDDSTTTSSATEKSYFENNAVNRDMLVLLAIDNTADVTSTFSGYTFRFNSTGTLTGAATVSNNLLTVTGTWTIDAAYNKITFSFPTNIITTLSFMNKEWQLSSRASATIELMSTDGENDRLQFSRK